MKATENKTVKCLEIQHTSFIMDEKFEKETEKAVQVRITNTNCGSNKLYWLPKSVFRIMEEGTFKYVQIQAWFFQKSFSEIK